MSLQIRINRCIAPILTRFWWGGDDEGRKMHWCKQDRLCIHKMDGGIGFQDLDLFNKALLAKEVRRLHKFLCSYSTQGILLHKFLILQVKKTSSACCVWRSILSGRSSFYKGLVVTLAMEVLYAFIMTAGIQEMGLSRAHLFRFQVNLPR